MNKSTSFQPVGSIAFSGILHAASRRSSLYGAVRWKEKPSRYNWAYSNGSSMASAFNVNNPIREWFLSLSQLPNSQCEAYNQQKYKHQKHFNQFTMSFSFCVILFYRFFLVSASLRSAQSRCPPDICSVPLYLPL